MSVIYRIAVIVLVVLTAASLAAAHGDPVPQRGGILQPVDEMDFELVVKDDKIDLYVSDDGEPMPSEGISGVLTIVVGSERSKAELKPAGINRLRAIDVTAAPGSRVIAMVTLADGKSLAVQFAIP